ncbi:MAG: hypothetical protein LBU32_14220 [Clostridiales bacterium]|nr:hypothetical protein [Clostridiales bacterium]
MPFLKGGMVGRRYKGERNFISGLGRIPGCETGRRSGEAAGNARRRPPGASGLEVKLQRYPVQASRCILQPPRRRSEAIQAFKRAPKDCD